MLCSARPELEAVIDKGSKTGTIVRGAGDGDSCRKEEGVWFSCLLQPIQRSDRWPSRTKQSIVAGLEVGSAKSLRWNAIKDVRAQLRKGANENRSAQVVRDAIQKQHSLVEKERLPYFNPWRVPVIDAFSTKGRTKPRSNIGTSENDVEWRKEVLTEETWASAFYASAFLKGLGIGSIFPFAWKKEESYEFLSNWIHRNWKWSPCHYRRRTVPFISLDYTEVENQSGGGPIYTPCLLHRYVGLIVECQRRAKWSESLR